MSLDRNIDLSECQPFSKQINEPLVIVGPSGAGKGTLLEPFVSAANSKFKFSVSYTTRGPRPGEQDGVHYNFISKEEFKQMIEEDAFIEHFEVHGNHYGTSKTFIKKIQDENRIPLLDIDI